MKLTVFDVRGFFALFRKHHSTTSTLSYSFPPRTTIAGMLAAILGYERDSYYSVFSSGKCRIALQVKEAGRHATHTLNYLMTDRPLTVKKLRGLGGRMPVHLDVLLSGQQGLSQLFYRVFFNHEDGEVQSELTERIRRGRFAYPPCLGTANYLADVRFVDFVDAEVYRPEGEIDVCTVLPTSVITGLHPQEGTKIFFEELVPADFSEGRRPARIETYVYGTGAVKAKLNCEVFSCVVDGEKVVGVFM